MRRKQSRPIIFIYLYLYLYLCLDLDPVTGEMQIKDTLSYHVIHKRISESKNWVKLKTKNVGKDTEQPDCSYVAGRRIKVATA